MKIWIKLLVGSILGALLGIFLPSSLQGALDSLAGLMVNVGRYALFPMVFFSLGIGTSELRQEKKLARVYLSLFKYLALSAGLLIVLGILSVLLFPPERIPIAPVSIQAGQAFLPVSVMDGLSLVVPRNLFSVLGGGGDFLLPLMLIAFILGANMEFDRQLTRPIAQLFDSLSRVFYHINSLVVELYLFAMVVLGASFLMRVSQAGLGLYKQILLVLAVDTVVVVFGVFPGCLYLLGVKENPYKWLYAAAGPALAALFSGDHYVILGVLTKHGKESFGVPRMVGSAVYPVFASVGRAGTAMVASVSFLLVLRSYSGLEISIFQILWVLIVAFCTSFLLAAVPGSGAYYALFMLCQLYGKGQQEGYLILTNIAPIMVSFGAVMDAVCSAFVSLLVAREEGLWTEVEAENFI